MCGRVTLPEWDQLLAVARQMDAAVRLHTSQAAAGSEPESSPLVAASSASDEQDAAEHDMPCGLQATPGMELPALVQSPQQPGSLWLASFVWGYRAAWDGKLVYNARIESRESSMWARSFASGRALVPVASFFEPHATETERNPRTGRMGKRAYEFRSGDNAILLLGAVCDTGRISIVTTEPNSDVAPIHARMPLVVKRDEVPLWLGTAWLDLADRSGVSLVAQPEHAAAPTPEQLSLF